jgi:cytochrome c2
MLDAVITKEIVTLEKAIEAKDFKAFAAGYDKFTAACNACHQGTENGFIVIKRPTQPAFTNQDYRPRN